MYSMCVCCVCLVTESGSLYVCISSHMCASRHLWGLPGKLKRLSRWPLGEGLGGGVALGGLLCWKGAGEEGVDEVVEDGLLLESSWFSTGGWSWWGGDGCKPEYLPLLIIQYYLKVQHKMPWTPKPFCFYTFFVMAFGNVPNCGASGGRSTGLFISDGTDSVLRILATRREIESVDVYMQNTCCPSTAWLRIKTKLTW